MELAPPADRLLRPVVPPHPHPHAATSSRLDALHLRHVRRLRRVRRSHQHTVAGCRKLNPFRSLENEQNKGKNISKSDLSERKKGDYAWSTCWCPWSCRNRGFASPAASSPSRRLEVDSWAEKPRRWKNPDFSKKKISTMYPRINNPMREKQRTDRIIRIRKFTRIFVINLYLWKFIEVGWFFSPKWNNLFNYASFFFFRVLHNRFYDDL